MTDLASPPELTDTEVEHSGFQLSLKNFSGPFDLLLSLIAKRRLDITDIALAEVTDEFLAYVATLDDDEAALDQSTSFIVVAATLLDLKTARLLPAGFADPEEELALLEERDLLFARLLQYKAYKDVTEMMRTRIEEQQLSVPRHTGPEAHQTDLLPPLVWKLNAAEFGALAQAVFTSAPDDDETVSTEHLHTAAVSVSEQIDIMTTRLSSAGRLSFTQLIEDAASTMVVVVRFMGLLMMYRDKMIDVDQDEPLAEIEVIWAPQQ